MLVAALIGALVALLLLRALQRWLGSRRAVKRAARAGRGEAGAATLLEDAGYRIIARQARKKWVLLVDDEEIELELRADYLVELDGETLVAEVKTGPVAPELTTAATRRQLLEYRVAFDVDGVLLVCPERGTIHRVEFRLPRSASAAPPPARPRSPRAGADPARVDP